MKNGSGVEAGRIASLGSVAGLDFRVHKSVLKRAMDLVLAIPVMIFLAPLMVGLAILVKLGDPGAAIFVQVRCGRNGETFKCYKFRTMRTDADARLKYLLETDPAARAEWDKYQKLRDDPRVTYLGKFLRKSSLDELPQLFNILRGELSVIGPRPITSGEIFRYGANFHYYSAVRPGVLGQWQVSGRNALTYDERVAMDVDYVRTWSIWNDAKILVRAIPVVFGGGGAY
jgi:lipopolysaccharide/colanic/teichoic acid biosynthesis glycosyltransferase